MSRFFRSLGRIQDHCRNGRDSWHATLALAAEVGAVNFVRAHPTFLELAGHNDPPCTCLPLLYRAVTPALTSKLAMGESTSPRPPFKDMISLLLAHGVNPNTNVDASTGGTWTPWMGWLRIEGLMAEVPDKAVFGGDRKDTVIDIAELFLAHGADPTQVRNNTLQAALSARGSAIATGKLMPHDAEWQGGR